MTSNNRPQMKFSRTFEFWDALKICTQDSSEVNADEGMAQEKGLNAQNLLDQMRAAIRG